MALIVRKLNSTMVVQEIRFARTVAIKETVFLSIFTKYLAFKVYIYCALHFENHLIYYLVALFSYPKRVKT